MLTLYSVNDILSGHNINKQMTDSREDVCHPFHQMPKSSTDKQQVAYLMADLSDVDIGAIRELYQRLESLSCRYMSMLERSLD